MYKFAGETEQERIQWIEAIKPFVEKGLLANLMKARKQSAILSPKGSGPLTPKGAPSSPMFEGADASRLQPRTRMTVDRAMGVSFFICP